MLSYLISVQRGEMLHFWMTNVLFVSNKPSALVRLIVVVFFLLNYCFCTCGQSLSKLCPVNSFLQITQSPISILLFPKRCFFLVMAQHYLCPPQNLMMLYQFHCLHALYCLISSSLPWIPSMSFQCIDCQDCALLLPLLLLHCDGLGFASF